MTHTPAGWYPDAQNPGQQRYWDGNQWTEHFAPLAPAARPMPQAVPAYGASGIQPAKKKSGAGRYILGGLAALVALIVIVAVASTIGSGSSTSSAEDDSASDTIISDASPTPASPTASVASPKKTKAAKPKYTLAQQSAMRVAEQYLDLGTGFSRDGLIRQMKIGNGFNDADATFAVEHMKIDFNKQAVVAAKAYMDLTGFSRSGMIQQLKTGNLFNQQQAEYACDQIGLE